ncbi:MAG: hypothetical protein IKR26_03405, partial [Lachnospiraceae bacterium]|nr:hypothetical protein [Lachnospiraceae bacterium]
WREYRELAQELKETEKELAGARKEAEKQAARAERFKAQTRLTKEWHVRNAAINELAKEYISTDLIDEARLPKENIAEQIRAITENILNNKDYSLGRLRADARALAVLLNNNGNTAETEQAREEREQIQEILPHKTTLTIEKQHRPADFFKKGGDGAFLRAHGINIKFTEPGDRSGRSIDDFWAEMSSEGMYPWLFSPEIISTGDQLDALCGIVRMAYTPQSGTPENSDWQLTDADYDEYLDWKTAQVMTDVIAISNEDKNKPTFADKKKAEREKAVYMAKVVTRDAEAAKWKAKMEKLSDQARIKSQQALDRVRAQRDERIAAIKQHNQEMRQAASERRQESADRTKLLNVARRLAKVKTRDTARQYIDSLIGDLDLVSKGITKKSIEKLSDLRDWYDEQVETNPDFIPSEWTKKQLDRLSKKHIADLDIDEVRKLTDVLLNIEHTIRMEKQFLDDSVKISTYNAGLNSIDDIRASGGVKNQSSFKYGAAISLLRPKTLLAKVVGYKQDSPFYKIGYEKMAEGEAKMIAYQNDAEARFKKFWDDKKFVKFLTEEKITIGGLGENGTQTAVITPDMRCALYMHYQNEDNVRHIATGGVVVPDYDLLRAGKTEAAYNKGVRIKLTPTQLRAIVAKVTAPELEYIRAAINYYENVSKPAINEVSNRQVGYSIAKVDNYFRISTNRNFLKKDFGEMSNDGTVASMGFTKERIAGASNPIDLVSLTSQLNQDIGNHAKYVGLSIPVADFNRLLNMQVTGYEASIKEALSQMWGAPVDGYIEKMMADFQGRGRDETKLERVINKPLNKIRSNYAAATLTLNLGVMLIQAASYHTAAAVLGWAATLKGMAKMGPLSEYEVKMMYKYSPLQAYREKGFNSIEMGDIVSRKGKTPAVLQGIQKIDIMTTRKLFKACMYAVKAQGVKYDTPEFWEKVGKLHTEVIRATQPNYTAFERPDILRSNNAIIQALAMFKTQPMQNYNILYEALGNLRAKHRAYQNGGSKEEYIKAKKEFADSFSAIGVSTLVFAGINMLWALIRRKEDEYEDENGELTFGSVMKGLGIDSISSLSGMVPLGGEIAGMIEHGIDSIIEGFGGEAFFDQPEYDITAPALEMITNLKNGIEAISDLSIKSIFDFENTTPAQWEKNFFAFEKALENISQVGGVPMANIRKLAAAIFANVTEPALGEYEGRYITMRISQSVSKNKNEYAQLLFDAFENDKEAFKTLYDSMTTDEVFATDSKGAKEVIDEKLTGIITDKLKAGEITDAQAIKYLTDCVGMGTEKAEKKVSSIKTNRIKEDYLEGNITADQAKKELEENGSDNAAWKVDGWDYAEENGDLEGHTKANNLFSAYLSGDSKKIKEAKGYYKSDDAAVTALTGEIGDRYRAGTLNKTATEKYLKNWCKKDSEDIFWSLDRWDYMKQHKDSDDGYSKYIRFDKAVESGKGRTAAVEFYKSHGFKLTTLKSAVTSRFKDKYIEAGRPYAMREKLLDMYQAIAYVYGETDFNRYKRGASIDKWTND